MAPKKTQSVSVVDGKAYDSKRVVGPRAAIDGSKVTVNLGIRMSADFQSASYDLGLTLPIMDGETPEEAMTRVSNTASEYFDGNSESMMHSLAGQISDIKKDFKATQK